MKLSKNFKFNNFSFFPRFFANQVNFGQGPFTNRSKNAAKMFGDLTKRSGQDKAW